MGRDDDQGCGRVTGAVGVREVITRGTRRVGCSMSNVDRFRSIAVLAGAALVLSACGVGDLVGLGSGSDDAGEGLDPADVDAVFGGDEDATDDEDPGDEDLALEDDEPSEDDAPSDGDDGGDDGRDDEGVDDATVDDADEGDAGDDAAGTAQVEAACTDADTNLEPGVPADAERVEQASGDLLGDGQDDTIYTYAVGDADSPTFLLRIEAASGFVVEAPLDDAAAIADVRPLGAASFGGDRDVAFVIENSGASGINVGLWALHDQPDAPCALLPVTIPDHTVSRTFAVGGSTGHASNLACRDFTGDGATELIVTEAEADGDGHYDWRQSAWSWHDGGELLDAGLAEGTVADLADLGDQLGADCPGVDLP